MSSVFDHSREVSSTRVSKVSSVQPTLSYTRMIQTFMLIWPGFLRSRSYVENLTLHVTGIRQGQNIDYEKLSRSYLPLPPIPEQAGIVRYLDYVDRRIRRYVSCQTEAHRAAGGGEAGRRQPGRHARPGPQRPPQALRRRVAGRRAGALGGATAEDCVQHEKR